MELAKLAPVRYQIKRSRTERQRGVPNTCTVEGFIHLPPPSRVSLLFRVQWSDERNDFVAVFASDGHRGAPCITHSELTFIHEMLLYIGVMYSTGLEPLDGPYNKSVLLTAEMMR